MRSLWQWSGCGALACLALLGIPAIGVAQTPAGGVAVVTSPGMFEIYGFAQADAILDFNQNNPKFYDMGMPSKLPSRKDQYGTGGNFYLSPRQTRFGIRAEKDDVKANFEFDLFGSGHDAGLTTIRLRHAYGQWKQFGAGQTNSQFMDIDVLPNTLDYWGPNGMLFFRNVQVFWEPVVKADGSRLRLAIEAPGGTADEGIYADRIEIQNLKARFPSPDYTGHYRHAGTWGYVQLGGALRYLAYDDLLPDDAYVLSDHAWGWGFSASSNLKVGPKNLLRLQFVDGAGIENYFIDAPIDVAAESNIETVPLLSASAPTMPVKGKALPVTSFVAYLEHKWAKPGLSTTVGYSRIDIDNTAGQAPDAYKSGQFFSASMLYALTSSITMSGEILYAHRDNFSDGFSADGTRAQFSFKYSFSHKVGG